MANQRRPTTTGFAGFERPTSNFFRMPNEWTDITAEIRNLSELKVVEYILRHTWGYQEYDVKKHITIDEFVSGRRRQDGSRMDLGTGLSERAVYDGLRLAVERGLIEQEVDDSDRGRTKKFYSLRMLPGEVEREAPQNPQPGVQSLHPPLQTLQARPAKSAPRSEKDTGERKISKVRTVSPSSEEGNGRGTGTRRLDGPPEHARWPRPIGEVIATTELGRRVAASESEAGDGGGSPVPARHPSSSHRVVARPRRVPHHDESYQVLQAYVSDFALELNDQAPLRASTMRAYNLLRRTGLPREEFIAHLYTARAVTKERTGSIRSRAGEDALGAPVKAKMAFFFAVLEDLLGLRDPDAPGGPETPHADTAD